MVEKYTDIVALVHPLYDVVYTSKLLDETGVFDKNNKLINKNTDALFNPNTDRKQLRTNLKYQIKKSLGIYGAFLNQYISKSNACVVIYIPRPDFYEPSIVLPLKLLKIKAQLKSDVELYNKLLTPFIKHYESIFKNRLYVTDYVYGQSSTSPILSADIVRNLSMHITLTVIGEYNTTHSSRGCVNAWKNNISNFLWKKDIKVHEYVIPERTLSFKSEGLVGFRKKVLPKHEKRELQQKKKKVKLKINQLLKRQVRL